MEENTEMKKEFRNDTKINPNRIEYRQCKPTMVMSEELKIHIELNLKI